MTLRCRILTLKTSDLFFRSFRFLRQNGAFSATEQNQTYKNSLFFRIPTTIQQKTYSLWRIPILTKYRFRIVRKKKKQYIPDADEHLKHSDYRADGISCFFFFRLYKIYKLELCLFFRCLCYLHNFFKRSSSCGNYCGCNRSFCNRTINHLDLAVFHRF